MAGCLSRARAVASQGNGAIDTDKSAQWALNLLTVYLLKKHGLFDHAMCASEPEGRELSLTKQI